MRDFSKMDNLRFVYEEDLSVINEKKINELLEDRNVDEIIRIMIRKYIERGGNYGELRRFVDEIDKR